MNIRDEKIIEKIRNFKPSEDCIGLSNLAKKCKQKKKKQLAIEEMEIYDYILDNLYKLKTEEIKEFSVGLSDIGKILNKTMIETMKEYALKNNIEQIEDKINNKLIFRLEC